MNIQTESKHTPTLDEVKGILTRYGRCCALYQDGLGQFHCHECGQVTFSIVSELQNLFGIAKDGNPLNEKEHQERIKAQLKRNHAVDFHEALLAAAKEAVEVLGHTETMSRKECALCSLQQAIAQADGT